MLDNKVKTLKGRDWCVTSYKLENYDEWKLVNDKKIKYMVYQEEECPDTKRLHLQCYLECFNSVNYTDVKKMLNDNSLHCELRKGSDIKAREYCMKEESKKKEYVEIGKFIANKQGKRTDLECVYNMVKNGKSDYDIQEEYPSIYCKFYKGIEKMRNNIRSENVGKFRKVDVSVKIGIAGSGKTKSVYDEYDTKEVYRLKKSNNDNVWFDDYKGEKVLLIDDFYGWIKYSYLLELLDGYCIQLDCKGSYTYAMWDKVIITSNNDVDSWYKVGITNALKRRISDISYFKLENVNENVDEDLVYDIPINVIVNNKIVDSYMFNDRFAMSCYHGGGQGNTKLDQPMVKPTEKNEFEKYMEINGEDFEEVLDSVYKND